MRVKHSVEIVNPLHNKEQLGLVLSPYLHRIGLLTDCVLRPNGMTGAPMKVELSEVVAAFQSTASNLQKQLPSFDFYPPYPKFRIRILHK